MREILFRGKRKDNGEWVEGYLFYIEKYNQCLIGNYDHEKGYYDDCEVDPETVGQYTGLTDQNGVKIFEGDVVKHETMFDKRIYPVVFDDGAFCYFCDRNAFPFADYEFGIDSEWVEIIGNIHDNPELLKEGGE